MQKILDRTQESLGQAFASLANNARRQQRVYLATIGLLMLMVVVFALVLAVVAAFKQLEYRRTYASQNATDLSLLLHREESFLRRAELTLDYYYGVKDIRRAPEAVERSIAQTGAARGKVDRVDAEFDVVIGQSTRAAWGARLGDRLGRLYESGQSTLVTQQAFELEQRATLIGVDEDYAVILPSLGDSAAGPDSAATRSATSAPPAALAGMLRETIERELQSQAGKGVPGKGERVWVGPYRDPLQNAPVISAVSVYYEGDKPVTLISASIPLNVLAARIAPPGSAGATLLMAPDRRILVSSAALDAQTGAMLQQAVAATPPHVFYYGREGVIFHEPLMPGFGSLVGYVPWEALAAALGWQLAVIGGLALLILLAIALTARFFGLRLLRNAFAETSRALESDTLNHILVSATPVGLCIVRQSDYSILTANSLAAELLQIEPGTSRLPPHIAAEFLTQAPEQASVAAFARIAAFVAPARPQSQSAPVPHANAQAAAAPDEADAAPAQFLQFTYAPARYAGDNVLFCAILDVTAQHALEQQLRHAQQTSEAMMRARTNFFAAMSHEIRTPLNALLGNLELFARTPGLEAHAQRLATVNVAGDALRRVVNDILDFSKIDAGEMLLVREPFLLLDAFESIALSYAAMAGERPIRFYSLPSPALDRIVIGDRMRVAQVINNLLSNAFKFTSSGKIMLQADLADDAQGRPVLNCRVSDSGPGISQELVTRLFKPFVQGEAGTSRGAESTGLGLVICARLCRLMGGTISAESVVSVGSVFNVSIPLAGAPDEKPAPVTEKRGTLLALCQDAEVAELLGRWLEHFGWSAHVVPTLAAAQAWLQVNRPKALVVSDAYDLNAIASLRALQPVSAVWVTRAGPHRPGLRGEGVFEVTEFSGTAVRAAIHLAVEGLPLAAAPSDTLTAPATTTPATTTSTPAPGAMPLLTTLPALQGLTVLVAEDNPLIQSLIAEQLATLGCVPTIAGDGKQALGLFERTRFNVVLTDIHMPALDGYELLAALRMLDADVPVLAFSAVSESQGVQRWRERGFSGYVSKPASLSELQAALLALAPAVEDGPAPAAPASAAATKSTLAAEEKARYTAMLKEHLKNDLPRLLAIVDEEDRQALAGWAHSASGAFVIVQEPGFVEECRQLQRLCNDSENWTTEMDERAVSLHDALCDHYGVDEAPTH
ncbi:ATP-binding protein [Paraburkholderia dilworthii]|uniref:ATP-binding protein n=1 Tax=Paraburkholderia dilworthii TaxID=948106 RepID=UPI0004164FFB|nr:ATP-binding protein [Paraburkholderia dilworthii]